MADLADIDSKARRLMHREQVRAELVGCRAGFVEWLNDFAAADLDVESTHYVGRHETQLKVLRQTLLPALDSLIERTDGIDMAAPPGGVHEQCRRMGDAAVWFERLSSFLRTKFDQRLGIGARADLLRAADEVVWSCYAPVIQNLPAGHPARIRAVSPLAYVEPEFSPAAMQFDRPLPPGLRMTSGDAALDRMLERLPIATVRLPPWCVASPWWLVFVAHEVGHHVQHELGWVGCYGSNISGAAQSAGLDEDSCRKWGAWGEEIFADAFSVMAVGPAAVRAVTEVEWGVENALLQRKIHYPAPAIRIALMTELARRLGLPCDALVPLDVWQSMAERRAPTAADWRALTPVVDVLLSPLLSDLGSLTDICGFELAAFAADGEVAQWSSELRSEVGPQSRRELPDARLMCSAALTAWAGLYGGPHLDLEDDLPDARSAAQRENLCRHAAIAMRRCGAPGKRGGGKVAVPAEAAMVLADLFARTPLAGLKDSGDRTR